MAPLAQKAVISVLVVAAHLATHGPAFRFNVSALQAMAVPSAPGTTPRVGSFMVAEIKPHFACSSSDCQGRVREYVSTLAVSKFGIIAMLQTEFHIPLPSGYTAFGAACKYHHVDNAVVLVDTAQFTIASALIGETVDGYSAMPYVFDGQAPETGSMCLGDPLLDGERAYTGAVLRHMSGIEVCVIAATFPNRSRPLGDKFFSELRVACGDERPILFVADTNANPGSPSFDEIGRENEAGWGHCSDPATTGPKPCCNDTKKDSPYPRWKFDRTVLCRSGSVEKFLVEPGFVCGGHEEHRYTTAIVKLGPAATRNESVVWV